MVPGHVMHGEMLIVRKYAPEPTDVARVPINVLLTLNLHGTSANRGSQKWLHYSLFVRHVHPTVVHHISKKDDLFGTASQHCTPALPDIQVHDELAQAHKPRWALRVRAVVKNLGVGDQKNMCWRYGGGALQYRDYFNEFLPEQ